MTPENPRMARLAWNLALARRREDMALRDLAVINAAAAAARRAVPGPEATPKLAVLAARREDARERAADAIRRSNELHRRWLASGGRGTSWLAGSASMTRDRIVAVAALHARPPRPATPGVAERRLWRTPGVAPATR